MFTVTCWSNELNATLPQNESVWPHAALHEIHRSLEGECIATDVGGTGLSAVSWQAVYARL